jgi:Flp pilus assembly pilin Flp
MRKLLSRFVRATRGQDLAEYAIALAVIGTLVTAVNLIIAGNVNTLWENANGIIAIAAS